MKPIPLRRIDLTIGKPLPWAVYDKNQNLLMRAGDTIENPQQLDILVKKGPFRLPKKAQAPAEGVTLAMGIEDSSLVNTYDFEDMDLPIGSRLQVQSASEQNPERLSARYLGHIKGQSLLISTPMVEDKVLFIREGQNFVVRAFTGKTAFGFTTSVVRVCNSPSPYLHMSYPKQLHGVEIRSSKRLDVNIIASAQPCNQENARTIPCMLINVSPTGALVAAEDKLGNIGCEIKLTFRVKIGPIDGYIETPAAIRSITPVKDNAHDQKYNMHHGVQFIALQQQDILLLHSLAYQKMCESSES